MTDENFSEDLSQKDLDDLNNICEEYKKEDESVSQNLILSGFEQY